VTSTPGRRLGRAAAASRHERRQTIEPIRPVHVVLDIFLARPHDLDRTIDMLGDLHRVGFQPPAEAAADQMVVDRDLVQRQAGGLRRRRLDPRAMAWLPTQISQLSLRTWTVQFIGSIVACARNGTW
jgi:hypothetical protein